MHEDINVILLDMDVKIPEQVTKNEDGSYTIFLNSRLSHDRHLQSYEHALKHIQNEDFDREYGDVQVIEAIAHEMAKQPELEPVPADKYIEKILRLQKSREQLQRKLRKVEKRIAWIEENIPDYFDRMGPYFMEKQKLGDDY